MSSSYMECVKTGAIIQINDHAGNPNRWAKGDLYRFGSGYVMKAVAWCSQEPVDWMDTVHAEFTDYHAWWGNEGMGDRFDIIFLDEPVWFEYEGKPIERSLPNK